MTTNADLITRVRSNIHEPSTVQSPRRTDAEIMQWLQDAQLDYVHRVPNEHFPELIVSVTFSREDCGLPADYLLFHSCDVTHTLSGTYTDIDECFVIYPGDNYIVNNYPGYAGAWCKITGNTLTCGPDVISGTLTYVKTPATISSTSGTFNLSVEHEAAVVKYSTAMALLKVNDADSGTWLELYEQSIAAKGGDRNSKEIEEA